MKLTFKTKPYDWQRETAERTLNYRDFAILGEVGTGKTKCVIDILRFKYNREKKILRTLIISPLVTLFNWGDEIQVHSNIPEKEILLLTKASSRVKDLLNSKASIIVMNPEAAQSKPLMDELTKMYFEVVLIDEMHVIKNHKSKRAKAIIKISDTAKYRFGLTGTPILNSPMDIYMQWRFLDGGATFGKSFFTFRQTWFVDKNAGWKSKSKKYFPDWQPNPLLFERMQKLIAQKSVRVLKKDCLDLPPLIKEYVRLQPSKEQKKHYKEMKDEFITFVDGNKDRAVIATLALTKSLRLLQIAAGHMVTDEGEVYTIKDNPKLGYVEQYLPGLVEGGHQVILWCSFKHDYQALGELCDKLRIPFVRLTGEESADAKRVSMVEFESRRVPVIIAHRRAGGIGVNLVSSDYSIIYSRNYSLGEELQSEGRNHRGGSEQHERVTQINLAIADTIDEVVVKALMDKKDISRKIIDMVKGE